MFALLVGSNAINTLILRRDIADFTRKADAKIALLREVLEKVQKGEAVDVEGILGTGREESEKEWEEGRRASLLYKREYGSIGGFRRQDVVIVCRGLLAFISRLNSFAVQFLDQRN